jgi:hypothetical protein
VYIIFGFLFTVSCIFFSSSNIVDMSLNACKFVVFGAVKRVVGVIAPLHIVGRYHQTLLTAFLQYPAHKR